MFDGLTVCATDIDGYLKATILKPFGMTASGYLWDDALADRMAVPHDADGAPIVRPRTTPILAARYGAAGGLITTAAEYAKFMIEVIAPRPADAFRLTRASRDEMIRPLVTVDEASSWALGWRVSRQNGEQVISHGGENPGFQSFVLASPERKSGYVILTNGDNGFDVIAKLVNGDTPLNRFVTGVEPEIRT